MYIGLMSYFLGSSIDAQGLSVPKLRRSFNTSGFLDDDEKEYYPPTKEEILEGIREGFQDCLEGRTSPVEKMWDELMIQTTGTIDDEGKLILDEPLREVKQQDVDVVIWFIRNKKSATEFTEAITQKKLPTVTRESEVLNH